MGLPSEDIKKVSAFLHRAVSVACFRLAAGHDFLQDYLYRMRIVDSDSCPLCNHDVPKIGEYLNICPADLSSISMNDVDCAVGDCLYHFTLYWTAHQRMTDRSKTNK
ncbi:hypothetical protein TNCV_4789831 [Trichonephila clavipes]|nr:hypothetical protein TNCV_4789831 [Trichonephila clavipes]